mmetsp:Transcript_3412/g.10500  ORF Transcript_3412/g.10500 Transcript_3412/m.10500 type:complete len:85 (-) Transcript_3412:589-843(-)
MLGPSSNGALMSVLPRLNPNRRLSRLKAIIMSLVLVQCAARAPSYDVRNGGASWYVRAEASSSALLVDTHGARLSLLPCGKEEI